MATRAGGDAGGSPREADTLRVLLSTDNHLGYAEKDPVRGGDSFRTFQEILRLAQRERVDLLLLGGDLFHDNKPSRRTLYQTMRLLRTHCMGDGAVNFQVVSDQSLNFPNFGVVNFEDPNFNVELPIFSIHGNHDDPSREGGAGASGTATQSLAALDLLSAANLVNYFGKSDKVDAVEVFPVLLTKGSTRVAFYGLGNMRDERLNRMFAQQKVVFRRPAESAEAWFSIFVVHQNREDRGRGARNCVSEGFIPDFIDLVIWGHEHECAIDVQESVKGDFFVTQPGSSVATSLVEGEAKPKHVAVLEVNGQSFRMTKRELQTVRPFKMGEVILSELEELDPNDPDVAERIREYLEGRVRELLREAELEQAQKRLLRAKQREKQQSESPFPLPTEDGQDGSEKQQVLVRLRVEHTGFPVLVNQRFGGKFVGQVANPNDILLFYRRKRDRVNALDKKMARMEMEKVLKGPVRPTPLAVTTIEDILSKQLELPEQKLVFLPKAPMNVALEEYTIKNITSALEEFVGSTLKETQRELASKKDAKSTQDILSAVEKKVARAEAEDALQQDEGEQGVGEKHSDDDNDEEATRSRAARYGTPRASPVKLAKASTTTRKLAKMTSALSDDDEGYKDEAEQEDSDFGSTATTSRKRKTRTSASVVTTPVQRRPARSIGTAARKKEQEVTDDWMSDDDMSLTNMDMAEDDGDEDFELGDEEEEEEEEGGRNSTPRPGLKPRRGRAVVSATGKAKRAPATRKRLRKSSDYDEDDEEDGLETALSSRNSRPAASRTTAARSSQSARGEVDLCSSESEPEQRRPPRKRLAQKKPQPNIKQFFQKQAKQQQQQPDDDDVESDVEFTQLTGAAAVRQPSSLSASFSQTQAPSQASLTTATKTGRKLPLSMVAASQSQSTKSKAGVGTAAARKGWGRSRR